MSGYIGTQPVPQATQTRDSFTATSGQTSFATGGYTPNFLDVYLNGVKLAAADYTATNGSDVVLASGASTGDILEVVAFTTFNSASSSIDDNGNATAITIDSSENVGIGTASPTAFSGYTNVAANNSSGSMFELMVGGTRTANIQTSSSLMNIQTRTNIPIAFDINSSEKMRLTSDGLTFNGDTAAANALNDYEEGTWTPTFARSSSNPTSGGYTTQLGTYTKIGNTVFVACQMNMSSWGGGAGWYQVEGLPFLVRNINAISQTVISDYGNYSLSNSSTGLGGYFSPNSTYVALFGKGGGTASSVNNFSPASNFYVFLSGTYSV